MTAVPLSALATSRQWQTNYLKVLPAVQTHAQISFRRMNPADREEAQAEAVARACVTYARLARQKKLDRVYAGNLATFAAQAVRAGRRVGQSQSSRDVMSELTRKKRCIVVGSLTPWDVAEGTWREIAVETKWVSPADTAAFRLDFANWLNSWPRRDRKIIAMLAAGERGMVVARKFGISEGRVSQLRLRYQQSWEAYQSGGDAVKAA